MKKILFSLFILTTASILTAQKYDTVNVTKYGIKPNSRRNAVAAVKEALKECRNLKNPLLFFPRGRYDFWPQWADEKVYYESNTDVTNPRRCPILIEKMDNLTINGEGSQFIFHDREQPFTIDNSSNITIRNLSIDWDILLTAQGEILNVTDDYIDLKINKYESPYIFADGKLVFVGEGWKSRFNGSAMEFDRNTRLIAPQTGDNGCTGGGWDKYTAEELSDGVVRIHKKMYRKPKIGNFLVLRHSNRDHSGIFIYKSRNVNIEGVDVFHTAGLGILSQHSEDLSFINVKVVPNYARGRYLSGHDDGFHFSNCKGKILVDSCQFAALMDDPINIHGTSVKIIKIISPSKLKCRFMHNQSVGLDWGVKGDVIGFIDNKPMETIALGTLKSFTPLSPEEFEVEFENRVPEDIKEGFALENLSWTPDVTIQNSDFKSCRARGILVSTPGKVIIQNNNFESSGSAILIAGDANYWYETGAVKDVTIKNNKFLSPCLTSMYQFCEGIISIYPEIPELNPLRPYHKNITIEGNEFHPFDYPVLYAKSVDGLKFVNNKLIRSTDFTPFHGRKFTFSFEGCLNVNINGNSYIGDILGKNISAEKMDLKEIKLDAAEGLKLN